MSDRLTTAKDWNRARALKLHEHFQTVALAVSFGAKVGGELERVLRLLTGMLVPYPGGEMAIELSWSTINREWGYWNKGGRKEGNPAHVRRPEALLLAYKAGCGGHAKMPRKLIQELHRRMTHTTGGRDKHRKSPISVAWKTMCDDFKARRPLPGIDYDLYPVGAEMPWHYSTACNNKPSRALRARGNLGASAAKNVSAYVSLDYSTLRKGELYTLDDVRLDIVCIDEATGNAIEVVLYVFMEVASRMIVGYVMKPAAAIKGEDVDELLAHMLQVPGFGIGVGYVTHILFERGATACSDAAQALLEGVTDGRVKIHRTGIVGGVRWVGSARDKARGNAAGKAVIESFNRWLHYALLHLPGQRGSHYENQPQSLGDLGGTNFFARPKAGKPRVMKGTLIDQAEQLAQFEIGAGRTGDGGRRVKLKLPMLRLFELNEAVRGAIKRHNTEPGHAYRGHGEFLEEEVAENVWQDSGQAAPGRRASVAHTAEIHFEQEETKEEGDGENAERSTPNVESSKDGKRSYTLKRAAAPMTSQQRNGVYWGLWKQVEAAQPELDRFALTRRALGCVPKVAEMTEEQFAKVTQVFAAIVRDFHHEGTKDTKGAEVDQPF